MKIHKVYYLVQGFQSYGTRLSWFSFKIGYVAVLSCSNTWDRGVPRCVDWDAWRMIGWSCPDTWNNIPSQCPERCLAESCKVRWLGIGPCVGRPVVRVSILLYRTISGQTDTNKSGYKSGGEGESERKIEKGRGERERRKGRLVDMPPVAIGGRNGEMENRD